MMAAKKRAGGAGERRVVLSAKVRQDVVDAVDKYAQSCVPPATRSKVVEHALTLFLRRAGRR